ncbi:hypothetical protein [Polaribacter sp. L3A8]|uniref:hypothetical protein n=1 Tax=Polaribacter sp. L3A8 TaxID=2686361 RepID=UPI00131DBD17|nr:hypothetical protein [Polaribacter sp. L3A8]
MKIEKQENYILFTSEEKLLGKLLPLFLKSVEDYKNSNIILQISDNINASITDFSLFLRIAEQKKENGTSFVIVNSNVNIDDFPDNFNITPTLQEAIDILDMEAMERELGF